MCWRIYDGGGGGVSVYIFQRIPNNLTRRLQINNNPSCPYSHRVVRRPPNANKSYIHINKRVNTAYPHIGIRIWP